MATYTKIDNETIKEDYTEVKEISNKHNIKFLKQQKLNIQADIDKMQVELQRVKDLIQTAKNLGVE
jgi:isopropylmalate/homocitrate/citramalate synthase